MRYHSYYVSFTGASTSGKAYSGDMIVTTEGPFKEEDIRQVKKLFMEANPDKGMTYDRMQLVCIFELDTTRGH